MLDSPIIKLQQCLFTFASFLLYLVLPAWNWGAAYSSFLYSCYVLHKNILYCGIRVWCVSFSYSPCSCQNNTSTLKALSKYTAECYLQSEPHQCHAYDMTSCSKIYINKSYIWYIENIILLVYNAMICSLVF